MKILQICNKPPFPPQDGGSIGMHNVTQGLIDLGHDVKVFSVNTSKHFVDINQLPKDYVKNTKLEFGFIDTNIKAFDAFSNLIFSNRSYNITRFEDTNFKAKLISILQKETFDIVQIESIFLNYYIDIIRNYSDAKIVLRAPNVEFIIWERMAKEESNPLKKQYLKILAKRLKKEELACLNRFDAIYTVTQNDMDIFKSHGCYVPMEFVPTGIDVTKDLSIDTHAIEYPSIFHIGALDWMPNQEGLSWFLENVWSKLTMDFPKLKLYIAGRGDASWFDAAKYPNVVLLGEIDDAAQFIKSKAIMIVPLFSGSGMRVKIIEGMSLGKAIVSTSIGIEGIIHADKENVLIANKAEEYKNAIVSLLENKNYFEKICKNARQSAKENYGNNALTNKLITFLEEIKSR